MSNSSNPNKTVPPVPPSRGRAAFWATARVVGFVAALVGIFVPHAGLRVYGGAILLGIITHEAGHLLAAKAARLYAKEYQIGFGPKIVSFRKNETIYSIRLIPAGGAVSILGMTSKEDVPSELESRTYRSASAKARLFVILAGVAVNFVVGISCMTFAHVQNGEAATEALGNGLTESKMVIEGTFTGFGALFSDLDGYASEMTGGDDASGIRFLSPIGGARVADANAANPTATWQLVGIIQLSLGLFNLLPFLPLDGGHAFGVIGERAVNLFRRGRGLVRFDAAKFAWTAYPTLAFFLLLSVTALVGDIVNPI